MSFDKENPEMLLLLETFQQFDLRYLIVGATNRPKDQLDVLELERVNKKN